MTDQFDDDSVDGRTARRVRNRDAVLDAVLDLLDDGYAEPGAAEVAERSGVSLRSVYRYFEDTDQLVREAIIRGIERIQPMIVLDRLGEGPLTERIERTVANSIAAYNATGSTARAAFQRSDTSPQIREQLARKIAARLAQVNAMFRPEIDLLPPERRVEMAAMLSTMLSFQSFERLRRDYSLSTESTHRTVAAALEAILTPVAAVVPS